MESNISDVDLTLSRTNIALARSNRIIQSWLPSANPSVARDKDIEDPPYDLDDDDDDELPQPDNAGIGSKLSFKNGSDIGGPIAGKNIGSDRLLEQLFGKKAGQMKKRLQEPGKSMSAKKHAAPKSVVDRTKSARGLQSDDEDEGGRSAAFKSRKAAKDTQSSDRKLVVAVGDAEQAEEDDEELGTSAKQAVPATSASKTAYSRIDDDKPAKKRGNSYLDELLAHKAKKSKKKKNKASIES